MSPKVLTVGNFVFYFHSYDVLHENRASIHVGKQQQADDADAKIWLEPHVEIARTGRTLRRRELNQAIKIVSENRDAILERWHEHRRSS